MGTINAAFGAIASALDADQSALSIVANNVANANTTGYTREIPNWRENPPVEVNGVLYGTGVTGTGPTSVRDNVLEERLSQQQQVASASGTRLSALDTLQALFPPDSGSSSSTAGDIGSDITNFFDSFSSLEANPADNALRQQVLSSGSLLASDISNAAASMTTQRSSLDQEASGITGQVNALTSAIAQLNQEIESATSTPDAGTLQDQREQDISQLSQLIGVNQVTTENSGLSITTTAGQVLVLGGKATPLTTGIQNGVTHFFVGATDVTSQFTSGGGQIGGYLAARDQDIPDALSALDQLAYGISTAVNAQNNSGTDLKGIEGTGTNSAHVAGAGTSPLYLFNEPMQVAGSALSMRVTMADPSQIAAAGYGNGTGDDSNAIAMANLANQPLTLPVATTSFSLVQNLSSATPIIPPGNTVTGTVNLYDSLGNTHALTVTYSNLGAGQWNYSMVLADRLTANTSFANQVSYTFGAGETVDPGTNFTITGATASGGTATVSVAGLTAGEAIGDASTGYVKALDDALATAGVTGVTVTNSGGVLTIAGATATGGSLIANPTASASANGTLQFNPSGNLTTPSTDVADITFSGLSAGAATLNLDWQLYGVGGASNITQTAAISAQRGESQNGSVLQGQIPIDAYASFVSQLGSTASETQTENTAQTASVSQLQTQVNTLSGVNLNDEAASLQQFERSYQAASEVFTILNTVIASALNLGVQTAVS